MRDNFDASLLEPKKKKKINSRTKGNRFENKIAKMLNERFNTDEFCRTPGSGAFATTHKLPEHLKIYGDLITPLNFRFIIECKKGYNKEGVCDLFNPKSNLFQMIVQASRDSGKGEKEFILVIGQDRKDPIVITNACDLVYTGSYMTACLEDHNVTILPLKDFLKAYDSYFFLDA